MHVTRYLPYVQQRSGSCNGTAAVELFLLEGTCDMREGPFALCCTTLTSDVGLLWPVPLHCCANALLAKLFFPGNLPFPPRPFQTSHVVERACIDLVGQLVSRATLCFG